MGYFLPTSTGDGRISQPSTVAPAKWMGLEDYFPFLLWDWEGLFSGAKMLVLGRVPEGSIDKPIVFL